MFGPIPSAVTRLERPLSLAIVRHRGHDLPRDEPLGKLRDPRAELSAILGLPAKTRASDHDVAGERLGFAT